MGELARVKALSLRVAAPALVLLAVACQTPEQTIDATTTTTSVTTSASSNLIDSEPPPIPSEASAAALRQERRHRYPDPGGQLQDDYGVPPLILPLGSITTDQLGIRVSFELAEWWRLEHSSLAEFVLTVPDNPIGQLRPNIVFTRPLGYFDPLVAPYGHSVPGDQTMPRDGLADWIDGLDQVLLLSTETFQLGAHNVTRYDVDLDPSLGPTNNDCSPGNCIDLMWNGASDWFNLRDAETVRYYEIDDPMGPIMIIVAAEENDLLFLHRADLLIRSLEVGPSAPHPVPDDVRVGNNSNITAGRWGLGAIPGLEFDNVGYVWVEQAPGIVLTGNAVGGSRPLGLVKPHSTADGTSVEKADDVLVALVGDPDWEVDVIGPATFTDLNGIQMSATEIQLRSIIVGDDSSPALLLAPLLEGDDPRLTGWPIGWGGRLLIVEGPSPYIVVALGQPDEDDPDEIARAVRKFAGVTAIDSTDR